MFSTDFIFRQQENLVDNQKCCAGFRPLCNKILLLHFIKGALHSSSLEKRDSEKIKLNTWHNTKHTMYFVGKILLTYWEKKLFQWSRISKNFEITGIICSNSERFEQFLVTECFFNLLLEISQISKNRTIIIQIGKNYWDLEICRKS